MLGRGVNAKTLRRSLQNDLSEGARCETLGWSVARSLYFRRPGGSRWEVQAAFLLLIASEYRRKGRSGKRWDALSLALDAASRWANRAAVFAKG